MALRVWLPLNGDLHNQGLSDLQLTINTAPTYVDNGKIGKALSTGAVTMSAENAASILNNQEFSFACWIYVNADAGDTTKRAMLFGTSGMTAPNNRKFSIFQYPTCNDLHLSWQNDVTNTTFTGGTWAGYFPSYKWTHIAITYKNPNGIIYINGEKKSTFSGVSNSSSFSFDTRLFENCANNGRYLNDYRIYDHALSAKEVEEISKGLVLHYKLDNNGLGNPNNINPSKVVNRGCTSFIYDSSENLWALTCPINSSTWGFGFAISDTSIKWKVGEAWVISMEVYTPQTINWQRDINNKPDLVDNSSYTGNDYDTTGNRPAYTNGSSGQILSPGWNKIWFAQIAGTSYGLYNYSTNWGVITTSLAEPITIKIKNIKGEIISAGDLVRPTSYSPFLINQDNIIYDSSGYQNNGILNDTSAIYISNSRRYNASIKNDQAADSATYLIKGECDIPESTNLSFTWWMKPTQWGKQNSGLWSTSINSLPTDYNVTAANMRDSYFDCCNINGTCKRVEAASMVSLNEWHHYALTYDGANLKIYKDGIQKTSTAQTGALKAFTSIFLFYSKAGGVNRTTSGYINDFRIYVTTLTENQIKELYDTSATIDKNGNIYAREVIE